LSLALVGAAMAWLSRLALKLDAESKAAQRQAAFEENVRLALWRMDSVLTGLISMANARPYDSYQSLIRALPNSANAPSQVYFQFDPNGRLILPVAAKKQSAQLDELRRKVTRSALLKSIQYTTNIQTVQKYSSTDAVKSVATSSNNTAASISTPASQIKKTVDSISTANTPSRLTTRANVDVQKIMNANEQIARQLVNLNASNIILDNQMPYQSQIKPESQIPSAVVDQKPMASAKPADADKFIRTTQQNTNLELMNPIWLDKDLFLVRRVSVGKQEFIQGCWLDWAGIRSMLLKLVEDLLPKANLAPFLQASAAGQTRLLAAIPVLLIPGPIPEEPQNGWSILHMSLGIAWMGVLLATFAVAMVLRRTLELNQRRGAFVSAVTHELRTPLTTFRLYTEMLNEGMVTDGAKQKKYFATLHGEAERLSHLVENVLMYAQLENNRGGAERIENVRLADLKERIAPSLSDRAVQSGMELIIEMEDAAGNALVRADISAVERILFNLVDNAGKYGRADQNSGVLMSIELINGRAALSVRDHGSGIPPHMQKKLFMPFSKSASEAANSAPGVGLGLSISRGLARQMHGDLVLDKGIADGARFVLTLPLVEFGMKKN
jgi:signal transduction histidine kinase